jgi:hypothetical protein
MALNLPNTIANGVIADGDKLNQNLQTIVTFVNGETITRDGLTAMTGPLLLSGAPSAANEAVTKGYVDNHPGSGPPVGAMCEWHPGHPAVAPPWMTCQGQLISRSTYAALFGVIGTTYGAGDGTSTFNLPNNTSIIKVS